MNDEIKEILEKLEWYRKIGKKDVYYPECVLLNKKAFILLDYITNLQQENERLKKHNKWLEDKIEAYFDNVNMQNDLLIEQLDYKSRCEKASECIDKQKKKMYKSRNKIAMFILMKLENILQNGSDEE